MKGSWYDASLRTLRALDLPLDADEATERRTVQDAYPFGERAHWPYKAWLRAVKDWRTTRGKLRAFAGDGTAGGGE